jgi:hypothetical protein
VIAHSVRDQPVDQEFIDLMKENRAGYIATLVLDEAQFIYAEHPAWMDTAAFRRAVEPNVRETWLTPEYASKIKRSALTRLNKAALSQGMSNVRCSTMQVCLSASARTRERLPLGFQGGRSIANCSFWSRLA